MERYSFSKVKSFYSCPFAFYQNYFEKNKNRLDHGMSEFGSFCHLVLEKYERGELEIYDMLPYYENNYNDFIKSDFTLKMAENFSKDFSYNYYQDGKNYFENFDGFEGLTILEAEYEFDINIDDKFIFTGKIDLIARDKENNLIVIDHKSKSKFTAKKEQSEYAKQLYLYSLAVYEKYGEYPTKIMFNMFRKGIVVEIEFNKDDYNNALNWLKTSVDEIKNTLEFPAKKDFFYCNNFCPYRHMGFKECEEEK